MQLSSKRGSGNGVEVLIAIDENNREISTLKNDHLQLMKYLISAKDFVKERMKIA